MNAKQKTIFYSYIYFYLLINLKQEFFYALFISLNVLKIFHIFINTVFHDLNHHQLLRNFSSGEHKTITGMNFYCSGCQADDLLKGIQITCWQIPGGVRVPILPTPSLWYNIVPECPLGNKWGDPFYYAGLQKVCPFGISPSHHPNHM